MERAKVAYKHPNGLATLLHLSQQCVKRNITRLQDVGTTPYHLLEPVLSAMSAKQLDQLEKLSRQLMPHTDGIWKQLIQKDFPDRVVDAPLVHGPEMPYKSLYYRYIEQRDEFRKDSAKRLRHLQQSYMKEKSKNKVITVNEVLRDPSRKRMRQPYIASGGGGGGRGGNNNGGGRSGWFRNRQTRLVQNSILERATRDAQMSQRSFGKLTRYDPYDAFKCLPIRVPKRPAIRRTTCFDQSKKEAAPKPVMKKTPEVTSSPASSSAPTLTPTPPPSPAKMAEIAKKRRSQQHQPSIFLQRKKPNLKTQSVRKPAPKKEPPSRIKAIKSPLFS
ncbi:uncharacterized protein LODBEIA_P27140 [Lodderomyces beijingensis]|uniref:Elongin-A n=1 Tax=Lodderomyces beijingensis TaxID=1775926 RepID=A0ABP0ZQK5_9ASCO